MRTGHNPTRIVALLLLLLGPALLEAQASLRCGNAIVQRGESTFDLLAVCGDPDLRETIRVGLLPDGRTMPGVERWTYNRGPQQLVRIVEISEGRIQRIDSGGYGYRQFPGSRCPAQRLQRGMSRLELLGECGQPDAKQILEPIAPGVGKHSRLVAVREEWFYDYGRGQIPRIVHLQAGKVVRVEQGRRR